MPDKILLIGGCGYIGSRLYQTLKDEGRRVDTLDLEKRGNFVNPDNIKMDYAEADASLLARYDHLLWFAGHSSVGMSHEDPEGALTNNLLRLFQLRRKMSPSQRLIYASTGGIYNAVAGAGAKETETRFNPANAYDISKYALDVMMQNYAENFAALRLGTLAGPSPNTRYDLVINAMTKSAMEKRRVLVFNGGMRRSILGLGDCVRAVQALLDAPDMRTGFYNLASFNTSIAELGRRISSHFSVPLEEGADTASYDYLISNEKFRSAYGFAFQESVESLVQDLTTHLGESKAA